MAVNETDFERCYTKNELLEVLQIYVLTIVLLYFLDYKNIFRL